MFLYIDRCSSISIDCSCISIDCSCVSIDCSCILIDCSIDYSCISIDCSCISIDGVDCFALHHWVAKVSISITPAVYWTNGIVHYRTQNIIPQINAV